MPRIVGLGRAERTPAIDEHASAIDELAFVMAAEELSTRDKVRLLEQWRYDSLLIDLAAAEGLGAQRDDASPLQEISKILSLLERAEAGTAIAETRPQ
jgi:hypothetical protein